MIHIMSKTIAKISYFFIFIISLFLIFYFYLLHGISIDSLELPRVDIKKLYIKLDKKLIVKIDYLKFKKNYRDTNAKNQLLSVGKYLKYFNLAFKELDIKKIRYENNEITLRYKKNLFFLETNQLYLLSNISLSNKNLLNADIKKLYIKPYRASFIGFLKANFEDKKYDFDGTFFTHNINGKVKLTLKQNLLQYYIYDVKSPKIAPFMDFLNSKIAINKIISNWIYKYIVAKDYDLRYLYGNIDIKTGEIYPLTMQGEAVAKDVKVRFHKDLPQVSVKKISITLKNDTLSFKLYKPTYENIDLNGSYVKITNLLRKGAYIDVVIKTTHYFDKKIKKILKAYNISVPISQKGSKTKAKLRLTMPFVPFSMDIKGHFVTKNSYLFFKKIKFFTKFADIYLHNDKIDLKNTNISYKDIFDLNTTGVFSTKNELYKGDIFINRLNIRYKDEILIDLKDKKTKATIEFKKGEIFLPSYSIKMAFKPQKSIFFLQNIKNIYPYSPLLQRYSVKNASAKISTKDFNTFKLISNIKNYKQNILLRDKTPIHSFNIKATIDKNGLFGKTDDIELNVTKTVNIATKNISFDLRNKTDKKHSIDKFTSKKPISLISKNSTIYLKDSITVPTQKFTLKINNDTLHFFGTYKDNLISYIKKDGEIDITTNFITSSYLNTIIGKKLFHGGGFKITMKEKNELFKGKCRIKNSTIKSIKKGGQDFKIDSGSFDFYYTNDILTLKNIVLKNSFSTLLGNGYIDIQHKKLNLTFKVTILKQLGKTISSIPFLGYILLGKNGKFTSKAKIEGSFDNPVITTDFAKNVIKSPFNIIFRIIKTPFKLFLPDSNPSK